MNLFPRLASAVAVVAFCGQLAVAQLIVTPDHADGIYQLHQPIHWKIQWKGATSPASVYCILQRGGKTQVQSQAFPLQQGTADVEATLDAPGTLLLTATCPTAATTAAGQAVAAYGGAIAAPFEIQPSAPRPSDFDQFWDSKIAEVKAIPPNAQLEQTDSGMDGVDYWKITLDNIRGTHIHGQLAKPAAAAAGQKFPALLIVQWAGVYGLEKDWVTPRAKAGWLTLDIEPHDLPIDRPKQFYKDQFDGPLKEYWSIGNDDRDTSYFLRMYLSCYQAAEYLAHRDDWDGHTLVVMGDSQGGQQTLMTAAIEPRITAAMALVPAGCDMLGPDVGRDGGWPKWYYNTAGKDPAKVRQASRYYDIVNFAPRIHCPVLVGTGLIDQTCPPAGVLAAFNQIRSPKKIMILPHSEHQDHGGTQAAFRHERDDVWLPALCEGRAPPGSTPR